MEFNFSNFIYKLFLLNRRPVGLYSSLQTYKKSHKPAENMLKYSTLKEYKIMNIRD